jgi:hypothetical protein
MIKISGLYFRKSTALSKDNQKFLDDFSHKLETYTNDLAKQEVEPSSEYEYYWRRIYRNVKDLMVYTRYTVVRQSYNISEDTAIRFNKFLHLAYEHKWLESSLNFLDL